MVFIQESRRIAVGTRSGLKQDRYRQFSYLIPISWNCGLAYVYLYLFTIRSSFVVAILERCISNNKYELSLPLFFFLPIIIGDLEVCGRSLMGRHLFVT